MGAQQSVERKVRKLRGKPFDEDVLRKMEALFARNPNAVHDGVWNVSRERGKGSRRRARDAKWRSGQARESAQMALAAAELALYRKPGSGSGRSDASNGLTVWTNCVGEQKSTPLVAVMPESLQQLVSIVSDACHLKQRVRAVGSGHSFSNITNADDAVLVDMALLKRVGMVDNGEDGIAAITSPEKAPADAESANESAMESAIEPASRNRSLARVQAGITIRELNAELDKRGLALINMGAFDGQTLAGVISTATHGSGITYGPLPNSVRAIVLVSETGTVYQIEPSSQAIAGGPLSNPDTFPGSIDGVRATLKQDDNWFRAVLVSMGSLGVIYSYVVEVREAFYIEEMRTATRWEDIRTQLIPERWDPVAPMVAAADHFELVLNPYLGWSHGSCVRVERKRLRGVARPSGERLDWLAALLVKFSITSMPALAEVLNHIPMASPVAIQEAIGTLVEKGPYTDKSFRVFNLGAANCIKAQALELHCDAAQCVPVIDKLLTVFQEEAKRHNWYLAGPLGIRFTAPADAFLAQEAGRLTCAIELDMLEGVDTGSSLARNIKERMCRPDPSPVRVHWGLDVDLITADNVRAWYPDFEA